MKITTEDIRMIKPGEIKAFPCEDAAAMYSGCSLVSILKRKGMPEGVSDYETQKDFEKNILLIHAMGDGEASVLNK